MTLTKITIWWRHSSSFWRTWLPSFLYHLCYLINRVSGFLFWEQEWLMEVSWLSCTEKSIHNLLNEGRALWFCGLMHHVLDWEVEGSNLAAAISFGCQLLVTVLSSMWKVNSEKWKRGNWQDDGSNQWSYEETRMNTCVQCAVHE